MTRYRTADLKFMPTRHFGGRGSFTLKAGFYMVEIYVRQNNVDQALRALKKKLQNEGILREMKARKHYEKPSEKRVREKAEAVRRVRKLARKRAQLEGLIPVKKKKRRY